MIVAHEKLVDGKLIALEHADTHQKGVGTGPACQAGSFSVYKGQAAKIHLGQPLVADNPKVMQRIARIIAARLRKRESDEEEMSRLQRAWLTSRRPADLTTETGAKPLKVLAVNCGSSSLKYDFFDSADERNNASGLIERIGNADYTGN